MTKRLLVVWIIMASWIVCLHAQNSSATRFYNQGMTLMKKRTVESQQKAINAFNKAKVAYDSKQKKGLCNIQIENCNNTISKLLNEQKHQKKKAATKVVVEEAVPEVIDTVVVDTIKPAPEPVRDVSLSLSPNMLMLTKKGNNFVEVNVVCNQDKWDIIECPNWLTYTMSKDKIVLKTQNNNTKTERGGIVKIECYGKTFDLIVVQMSR